MRAASIAAAGTLARAPARMRAGSPAESIESAQSGRLVGRIEAGLRDVGGAGLLLVVGLLLGLILISAGCGPPS